MRKVEAQLEEGRSQSSPISRTERGATISASSLDEPSMDADFLAPPPVDVAQTRSPSCLESREANLDDTTIAPDGLPAMTTERSLILWVEKYHPWFPILHPVSIASGTGSSDPRYALVRKAVTAVVALDQAEIPVRERRAAEQMARDVLLEGLSTSSLQTVQALLIVSNYHYASGNHTEFWNILAICKR